MKFAGWGENRFREAGFRAVPGAVVRRSAYIAPGVGADAELRQCRRLCRPQHDGRYLGDGRKLRADRRELPSLRRRRHRRRAGAAAGQPGDHRGRLLHRRPLRGGRGRRSSSAAACCRWACSSARRPRSIDRATGEIYLGRVPAYSVVVPGSAAGQAVAGRLAGAGAVLRGDRQARGCADPRQDLDQRTAARLNDPTDPVPLAQALIRCPSVTPADAGAQDVLADALERLGFAVTRLRFGEIENLFARLGDAAPAFLLRRPHRCGAGRRRRLAARSVRRRDRRRRRAVRPRRLRHEGRDRRLRRRRSPRICEAVRSPARSAC